MAYRQCFRTGSMDITAMHRLCPESQHQHKKAEKRNQKIEHRTQQPEKRFSAQSPGRDDAKDGLRTLAKQKQHL